jgi:hypothetical protein
MNALQIDNDREWIQWWIEDEEWNRYLDEWWRENSPHFAKKKPPRWRAPQVLDTREIIHRVPCACNVAPGEKVCR